MADHPFIRTALWVLLASLASLLAEAWLSAGEPPLQTERHALRSGENGEVLSDPPDFAQAPGGETGVFTADLQDRLEKDLRARRPVEFEFIAKVVEMVENDTLPLALVNRCYLWARRQAKFPFQHFENAVRKEARRIGVLI